MAEIVPASHLDLLERPLFAHVATIRADGTPQVTPIWYLWENGVLALTTTTRRAKYRQMVADPHVSLSLHDPDQPYRYLEVRGTVASILPDPTGGFFFTLAGRYGLDVGQRTLEDAPFRVKVTIEPTKATWQ